VGFVRRIHGVTLRDKVPIVKSEKPWTSNHFSESRAFSYVSFGHVSKMSQEMLEEQILLATTTGKVLRDRPTRTRWRDYISDLSWSR